MAVIKPERFTQLKAKVKAEMQRRNQSGSVASYGGSSYDYSVIPSAGKTVRAEHRDKLINPMRAVNSDKVPVGTGTIKDTELANMETLIDAWKTRTLTDRSKSDCKSGCTGTCYTGCATGCYNTCTGGCSGCSGCSGCGGCDDGCWDNCWARCTNNCSGSCDGCSGCGSGCASTCSGGCKNTCNNTCSGGCNTTCTGECKGGCKTGCYYGCKTGCLFDGGCSFYCFSAVDSNAA